MRPSEEETSHRAPTTQIRAPRLDLPQPRPQPPGLLMRSSLQTLRLTRFLHRQPRYPIALVDRPLGTKQRNGIEVHHAEASEELESPIDANGRRSEERRSPLRRTFSSQRLC